jgi:purine-binding chemotaxis protein CheW
MAAAVTAAGRQLLTFRVAGEHLALPASVVAEIIRPPAITRVPLGPPGLAGIANLRGIVLPVVSLRALLGSERGAPPASPRVVIVNHGMPVGLVVDQVTALTTSGSDQDGGDRASLLDLDRLLAKHFGALHRRSGTANFSRSETKNEGREARRDEATLVSFVVSRQEYALPLERVSEIVALPPEIAVIPRAEDFTLGVTSVRDRLLPLVSLHALLGLPFEPSERSKARILVARVGGGFVGLVADGMKEILRVSTDSIDPVPSILTRGSGEAEIQAICRLDAGRRLVSILSTDRLLRDAGRNAYMSAGSEEGEGMVSTDGTGETTEQFVVFRLGGEEYGLPVAAVDEVVRLPETLTRLPTAPSFVEGVMNLRGRVIPIIDQRQRFAYARQEETRRARVVVVTIDHMQAGFVVDGVSEILRVPVAQLRPAPDLTGDQSRVIDRIANIEVAGRMILLLDAQELLDRAEKDLLVAMRGADTDRPGQ